MRKRKQKLRKPELRKQESLPLPPGFTLCFTLRGDTGTVSDLTWAPDGRTLASVTYSRDQGVGQTSAIHLWDVETGQLLRTIREHIGVVSSLAWAPDGCRFASVKYSSRYADSEHHFAYNQPVLQIPAICLWDVETGQLLRTFGEVDTWRMISVSSLTWAPNGRTLASVHDIDEGGDFGVGKWVEIVLYDVETGQLLHSLGGGYSSVSSLAWAPDGRRLAIGAYTNSYSSEWGYATPVIYLWDVETGQLLHTIREHIGQVSSLMWTPDGRRLASVTYRRDQGGGQTLAIHLWDAETGQLLHSLGGGYSSVSSLAWTPDGRTLAYGVEDWSIRLWNVETGQQMGILESHTDSIYALAFSSDGRFLASKSRDHTVRLWRTDSWKTVGVLNEFSSENGYNGLAFSPKTATILVTLGEANSVIHLWKLDLSILLDSRSDISSMRYTNAKVVLVGDSGVGKSGLGLVLTGQPFVPTDSTHGRYVWTFDDQEIQLDGGRKEMRETLLWDLAGQPGYRLVHQLHLNEVAVALIIFDSHSEIDPFAGVYYWDRALCQAQRIQGDSAPPLKKILVAARVDRGGVAVSSARIAAVMRELGIESYVETSAKDGLNIVPLIEAIKASIAWEILPWVHSTDFFQRMKSFLLAQKELGRLLSTADDLYDLFLRSEQAVLDQPGDLRAQFETCIGRMESRGLIRRLSFGGLVLLQPELLDAYASAVVNAVRDEPDGLGSIAEQKAREGTFPLPEEWRLKNKQLEKFLLIAMVEDLLYHEIALREYADDGVYLIFPSQSIRECPHLPDSQDKEVIFSFDGPVQKIYATLAVRLSHSGLFQKKALWKNAVTFTTKMGGTFGLFLNDIGEGQGELMLFFDQDAGEEARFHFEEYVAAHLQGHALSESIRRRRIFVCSRCNTPVSDLQATRRREKGFTSIKCNVCEAVISLLDKEERLTTKAWSQVQVMDRAADRQRDNETAKVQLEGKIATSDFDVFLCHHSEDKPAVKEIGEKLKERGILPWLDEWELRPGLPWQHSLEQQIKQIKSAAVFVGKNGRGPWQDLELAAFLRQFVKRQCPVIPVILVYSEQIPEIPVFLEGMTWVDFRLRDPNPMERLIWGITGKHNSIV